MMHQNALLATGAAAGAAPSSSLFFPLVSSVWADQQKVVYSFENGKGVFKGTKGAMLFAPESGVLTPISDGGFVLAVSGSDNDREWIGGFVPGLTSKFQKGEVVQAGQLLGTLGSDLVLGLKVTPKQDPNAFRLLDPARVLQDGGAVFTDLQQGAALAITQPTELTIFQEDNSLLGKARKPEYTVVHLAVAVSGGLVAGWLITRAFRKRY